MDVVIILVYIYSLPSEPASQLLMYLTYLLTYHLYLLTLCSKEINPAKILFHLQSSEKPPGLFIKKASKVDMLVVLLILQYSVSYDDDGGGKGVGWLWSEICTYAG